MKFEIIIKHAQAKTGVLSIAAYLTNEKSYG